ncbi:hypothetical protein [Methylocystis sp. S23]
MRSALYYPHTKLESQSLLKTSLLMWDHLEFIVPYPEYNTSYRNKDIERAIELFGVQRCPSKTDKSKAHDIIEDFATRPLPDAFFYRTNHQDRYYEIYPQKFMGETWEILQDLKLAGDPRQNADYPLTETAGLSVMSILADCCAGTTRVRVTDRGAAYAAITNLLVQKPAGVAADRYELVVPLTLALIKASSIPLENLINFREREHKAGGHTLRALRHRYLDNIETHIQSLQKAETREDWQELDRTFELKMKDDLRDLKDELRLARADAVFSKEFVTSIVVAGASAWGAMHGLPLEIPQAFTAMGAPVTVGGLLSTKTKYSNSRKSIMQKHPMAYLYELENSR